jgi:hypothetical protein
MIVYRCATLQLAATVAMLVGVVACGSNEPDGTTPVCKEPDAADCFTLPDGGNRPAPAATQPDAAQDAPGEALEDAAGE